MDGVSVFLGRPGEPGAGGIAMSVSLARPPGPGEPARCNGQQPGIMITLSLRRWSRIYSGAILSRFQVVAMACADLRGTMCQ
jgi:hypothetical protein